MRNLGNRASTITEPACIDVDAWSSAPLAVSLLGERLARLFANERAVGIEKFEKCWGVWAMETRNRQRVYTLISQHDLEGKRL